MRTKSKILVGLVLVSLAFVTVAGVSFAATDTSTPNNAAKGFVNGCRGFFGGAINEVAKLLKLKPEQIIEKRNAGQSLADIAGEQGVEQEKVVDTIIDTRKKFLDERVKAGLITQEQADLILERMKSRVETRIQDPAVGGCGGRMGAGGGCGMMGGRGGYGGRGYGPGAGGSFRNAPTGYTTTPGSSI